MSANGSRLTMWLSGEVKEPGKFKNGNRPGVWKNSRENGDKRQECICREGKWGARDLLVLGWAETPNQLGAGKEKRSGQKKEEGLWESWHRNGQKRWAHQYDVGQMHAK